MKRFVEDELPEPRLEDQIRLRAYELYVRGGQRDGHELTDWLQAEREVLRELHPPSTRDKK